MRRWSIILAAPSLCGCELAFPISTDRGDAGDVETCGSFASEVATGIAGRNPAMNVSGIEIIFVAQIPTTVSHGLFSSTFDVAWQPATRISNLSDMTQDSPAFYPDDYDQIVYAGGNSGRILGAERAGFGDPWTNTTPELVIPSPVTDLQCGPPTVELQGSRRMVLSTRPQGTADENLDLVELVEIGGEYMPIADTLVAVNQSDVAERDPHLGADGLSLWFASNRGGDYDIYRATRASFDAVFGAPCRVGMLDAGDERGPWLSPDASQIVFARGPSGGEQLFIATSD